MKKYTILLLITLFIITVFTACSGINEVNIPKFKQYEDRLQVYNMSFNKSGKIVFSDVGYANENVFSLTKPYLSRPSTKKQASYVYKSTPNFKENTEGALGIIIYHGSSYVVFQEGNSYKLKGISLYSPGYERQYEFEDFVKSASDYYTEYKDTLSGGNGLKR